MADPDVSILMTATPFRKTYGRLVDTAIGGDKILQPFHKIKLLPCLNAPMRVSDGGQA